MQSLLPRRAARGRCVVAAQRRSGSVVSQRRSCKCASLKDDALYRKFTAAAVGIAALACTTNCNARRHNHDKRAVTQGFFDLARLVASETSTRASAFDDLAYAIGKDAYADLNGWHLFLKDMSTIPGGPKMHQLLAEQLGDKILTSGFEDRDVEEFLKKIPVKLGQGKASVSLDAVLPSAAVDDIVKACKDWSKDQ